MKNNELLCWIATWSDPCVNKDKHVRLVTAASHRKRSRIAGTNLNILICCFSYVSMVADTGIELVLDGKP